MKKLFCDDFQVAAGGRADSLVDVITEVGEVEICRGNGILDRLLVCLASYFRCEVMILSNHSAYFQSVVENGSTRKSQIHIFTALVHGVSGLSAIF